MRREVGKDVTIPELREQGYKAFYLAIGLQKAVRLNVEGEELDGVIGGIDFLRGVNRGETTSVSGDTVVIGGGNAAIDVARAAKRLEVVRVERNHRVVYVLRRELPLMVYDNPRRTAPARIGPRPA